MAAWADDQARKFYHHFGVNFSRRQSNKNLMGSCAFCGRDDLFAVLRETGQYNCLSCGMNGNHYDFLVDYHAECLTATKEADYKQLSYNRGLMVETLKYAKLAKSILNDSWLIPSFSPKGRVTNLYQAFPYSPVVPPQPPGKPRKPVKVKYEIRSAPDPCTQQLYGGELVDKQSSIIVLEGHWDRLAMWEMLASLHRVDVDSNPLWFTWKTDQKGVIDFNNDLLKEIAVTAVPGATIFKPDWAKMLRGRHVTLMYDNDVDRVVCAICRGTPGYKPHLFGKPCPKCQGTATIGKPINPGKQGVEKVIKELDDLGIIPLSLYRLGWKPGDVKDVRDVLNIKGAYDGKA